MTIFVICNLLNSYCVLGYTENVTCNNSESHASYLLNVSLEISTFLVSVYLPVNAGRGSREKK